MKGLLMVAPMPLLCLALHLFHVRLKATHCPIVFHGLGWRHGRSTSQDLWSGDTFNALTIYAVSA